MSLTTKNSPAFNCARLPANAHLHICFLLLSLVSFPIFSQYPLLGCPSLRKELKYMQVSATLLPLLLLPHSYSAYLLPFVLLCAILLQCVVDTSWHVAKSPGHLSVLLSCPLSTTALTALLCRGALCWQPVTSAGALQQKAGSSQPANSHRFVSAAQPFDVLISSDGDGRQEDANNHLKNKNIPLKLVKDKLQFQ